SALRSHRGGYEQYIHDGEDHSDAREPHSLASGRSALHPALLKLPILSRSANEANQIPGARLSVSPKLEAPDVKLSGLLVAERRCDAVHHQLLLRDGLVASGANLAVGGTTPESCH